MTESSTQGINSSFIKKDAHGALHIPVYDNAAFEFDTAEDLEKAFMGQKFAHTYTRISNPTVENLEQKVKTITGAQGVVALSSGMAAIANVILAVCQSGENIITTKKLFGNTYSLISKTLKPWGLETRYVDVTNISAVHSAVDDKTRAIFIETITNPQLEVVDIAGLAQIAKEKNILLIVDSTMTPLIFYRAKDLGINIEVISATKYISGGATSVGGLIIDHGNFDWQYIPRLKEDAKKYGPFALLTKLRREVFRNLGSCLAPHNAYLQSLGLETLALRVTKSGSNALAIAEYLQSQKAIAAVNYPGLSNSQNYPVAKQQFGQIFGGLVTFRLGSKAKAFKFINAVQLIRRATNINDNKTLILHPASTIFCEYSPELRAEMGAYDDLVRLSVGIEDVKDLIADIQQALEGI